MSLFIVSPIFYCIFHHSGKIRKVDSSKNLRCANLFYITENLIVPEEFATSKFFERVSLQRNSFLFNVLYLLPNLFNRRFQLNAAVGNA